MPAHVQPRERTLTVVLAIQVAALLIAALVPFGFDHPSTWGLDYGHFLLLAALYLVALLSGVALAVVLRRWWLVAGELALPAAFAALALTGAIGI